MTFFDLQQGGVGFAETQLGAPWAGQRTMLRIESNRYVRLFLDGVELARRTRPDDPWLASAVAEVPAAGARLR
ncbi:MAG: hypothetical protein U1F43_09815 [Myxococcota bacterium]